MRIWVAILHCVGEDNDSNQSIVARTETELQQKLIEEVNSWFDGDDDYTPITDWSEWPFDEYHVVTNYHDVDWA